MNMHTYNVYEYLMYMPKVNNEEETVKELYVQVFYETGLYIFDVRSLLLSLVVALALHWTLPLLRRLTHLSKVTPGLSPSPPSMHF